MVNKMINSNNNSDNNVYGLIPSKSGVKNAGPASGNKRFAM
jgi:hypothetical protein